MLRPRGPPGEALFFVALVRVSAILEEKRLFISRGDPSMRRHLPTLVATLALAASAAPARAQLAFGVHGAVITAVDDIDIGQPNPLALNGTLGIGGRLVVSPPVFPIALVGSAQYYFTDCPSGVDCSLWTAEGIVQLGLPLPIVRPYVLGGLQYRKDEGGSSNGAVLGVGVQLNFVVSVFLEGMLELADPVSTGVPNIDLSNPFVIKGGILFG